MSKEANSGGTSILVLLFILFLGLKLGHVINWSWWWVFAPLWGMPAIVISALIIYFVAVLLFLLCAFIYENITEERLRRPKSLRWPHYK